MAGSFGRGICLPCGGRVEFGRGRRWQQDSGWRLLGRRGGRERLYQPEREDVLFDLDADAAAAKDHDNALDFV